MWVRNNKGNVFVGNLPPDLPDERLAETFDPFGIVLSAARRPRSVDRGPPALWFCRYRHRTRR